MTVGPFYRSLKTKKVLVRVKGLMRLSQFHVAVFSGPGLQARESSLLISYQIMPASTPPEQRITRGYL